MGIAGSVIVVFMVLMIWTYYWCFAHPKLDTARLCDLLAANKFKTGDLILFKAVDNFNAPVIMSYYGHIGIVYVDPDTGVPFIFEAADPTEMALDSNQNKSGIFISPLESRIKMYKGYTFHKELANPIEVATCTEFATFIQYCINNMSYNTCVISNGIKKGLGEKIGTQVNCGELVFLSLIKLGLLPFTHYEKKAFHHLKWMCKITHVEDNHYLDPVKITYSPIECV